MPNSGDQRDIQLILLKELVRKLKELADILDPSAPVTP